MDGLSSSLQRTARLLLVRRRVTARLRQLGVLAVMRVWQESCYERLRLKTRLHFVVLKMSAQKLAAFHLRWHTYAHNEARLLKLSQRAMTQLGHRGLVKSMDLWMLREVKWCVPPSQQ